MLKIRLVLLLLGLVAFATSFDFARRADAITDRVYTLPFFSQYVKTCGFGCYPGH